MTDRFVLYSTLYYYDGVQLGLYKDQVTDRHVIGANIGPHHDFDQKDDVHFMAEVTADEAKAIDTCETWLESEANNAWTLIRAAFLGERRRWLWNPVSGSIKAIQSYKKDWVPGHE